MAFAHLHMHSDHSLLDGYLKLGPAAEKVATDGQTAMAVTDHGTAAGWHEHNRACAKAGIKPIFGIEAYIAPGARDDRTMVEGFAGNGAYAHMTLLARDNTGLRNLICLSSLGNLEGFYRKPRIDMELLRRYSQGLIVSTGCPGSTFHTLLRLGQQGAAMDHLDQLTELPGATVIAEVMRHPSNGEVDEGFDYLIANLAPYKNVMSVATQDAHYIERDDHVVHGCMCALSSGKTWKDPKRFKFTGPDYWLKTEAEMLEAMASVQGGREMVHNAGVIADMCTADLAVLNQATNLPEFGEDPGAQLWAEVRAGLERKKAQGRPIQATEAQIEARLETEMSLIIARGFCSYFLMTSDWVRWSNSQGIRTGVCRGSGGGSLVAYLTDITQVDPMKWGLPWERFLNPERSGFPDFDIDVERSRRHEIVSYLRQRWGSDHVASIGNHNTVRPKAAIGDAARVLGALTPAQGHELSALCPPPKMGFTPSFDDMHNADLDAHAQSQKLRDKMYNGTPDERMALSLARRLEGVKRANGQHAAGLIISELPIWAQVPVRGTWDDMCAEWDWREVEASGCIKLDLLTLTTLDRITKALDKANVDENTIPGWWSFEDPDAFGWLCSQHSYAGLFQIGNSGIAEYTHAMQPHNTGDLSAAIALYRPGPMDQGMHNDYVKRKHGEEPVSYPTAEVEKLCSGVLEKTYGVMAYQENVMAIAQTVAGYSLGEADVLRRVMGKKKPDEMAKEWAKFERKAIANGVSAESAKTIWDWVEPFSGYGFNLSHSLGYAGTTFQTIQLARLYPEAWAAASLDIEDREKWPALLVSIAESGVQVKPIHHRTLAMDWTVDPSHRGVIRPGLNAVKGLSAASKASIVAGAPATPIEALLMPQVRFCDVLSLARLHVWPERAWAGWLEKHQAAIEKAVGKAKRGGWRRLAWPQHSSLPTLDLPKMPSSPRADPPTVRALRAAEVELLGIWVQSHPLAGASSERQVALKEWLGDDDAGDRWMSLAVHSVEQATSKKGNSYTRLTLADMKARVELFAFGKTTKAAQDLTPGSVVKCMLSKSDGRVSLRAIG